MNNIRIGFAGDRDIAVKVLDYILRQGVEPLLLLVPDTKRATHASELRELCSHLEDKHVLRGKQFREKSNLALLSGFDLDYLICIHFPYIVPSEVLSIPRYGVVNLHPAYLPYNRGWHTPSWSILENTPIGGTLHYMDENVDTGDIIHRKQLQIRPDDTANSLYSRVKDLEFEVFLEAWPMLVAKNTKRIKQNLADGTMHLRQDLFAADIQEIDLNQVITAGSLIRRLRALSTNRVDEAAYYDVDGERYRIQVTITKE